MKPVRIFAFENEVERELILAPFAAQYETFHQRFNHAVRLIRHRHRNAGCGADRLMFANKHLEHNPIDLIVSPINRYRSNYVASLTKTIDATFALFVARGVPRQVVMHDSLEMLLEIDAFRQTVGSD